MLTPNGVKLLDFGLAKLRDGEYGDAVDVSTKSLTHEGTVLGTLPHGPGAGRRARGRCAHRHLRARRRALRDDQRRSPVHGDSRASLAAAILTSTPRRSRHAQARSRRSSIASSRSAWRRTPSSAGRAHATWRRRSNGARPTPSAIATRRGQRSSSAGAQLPSPSRRLPPRSDWLPSSCGRADGRRPYFRRAARPGCSTRPPIGEAPSRRPVSPLMDEFRLAPAGKTDRGGPTWGVR